MTAITASSIAVTGLTEALRIRRDKDTFLLTESGKMHAQGIGITMPCINRVLSEELLLFI